MLQYAPRSANLADLTGAHRASARRRPGFALALAAVLAGSAACSTADTAPAPLLDADADRDIQSTPEVLGEVVAVEPALGVATYRVEYMPDTTNEVRLVGLDDDGVEVSHLVAYFVSGKQPALYLQHTAEGITFDGVIELGLDASGPAPLAFSGRLNGQPVELRAGDMNDPESYTFSGFDSTELPARQKFLAVWSEIGNLGPQLEALEQDAAYKESCATCVLRLLGIAGTGAACIAAIVAVPIACAGGPLTAPACVAAIGVAAGACGATSWMIADFINLCKGACCYNWPYVCI